MSSPIINMIKSRLVAVNRELNELKIKVNDKENEIHLIKLALAAMRDNKEDINKDIK